MPKEDLEDARARLAWANEQIALLEPKVDALVAKNVEDAVPTPPMTYARRLRALAVPAEIKTSIGTIIQAQRTSLEYLAHSLAERNGATKLNKVQFPICESEQEFNAKQSQVRIAELAPADKAKIAALKPFSGGNDDLYLLHRLGNQDRHRKLIPMVQSPGPIGIGVRPGQGGGYIRRLAAWGPDSTKDGSTLLMMDADPAIQLDTPFALKFGAIPEANAEPVIATLKRLSKAANDVIDQFDDSATAIRKE